MTFRFGVVQAKTPGLSVLSNGMMAEKKSLVFFREPSHVLRRKMNGHASLWVESQRLRQCHRAQTDGMNEWLGDSPWESCVEA